MSPKGQFTDAVRLFPSKALEVAMRPDSELPNSGEGANPCRLGGKPHQVGASPPRSGIVPGLYRTAKSAGVMDTSLKPEALNADLGIADSLAQRSREL